MGDVPKLKHSFMSGKEDTVSTAVINPTDSAE